MSLMIPMFLMSLRMRVLYALTILVDGPYMLVFSYAPKASHRD